MGEIRSEGLLYRVLPDGASVALVGWYGTAPEGNVLVPASVTSGEDVYAVVRIGEADESGLSCKVFADSKVTTLTLPASVQEIIEGALSGCSSLARIEVSSKNESFASFDGMLFSKDLSSLLTVPEGKEGAAHIPDQTTSVPASAFSQAPGLQSVEVGEGSVTFASRNGVLYSLDLKTLIACLPGAGKAAVIPAEVERIGEQAFAGCSLASITALGFVSEIAPDAFTDETKANALVALPAGEDYEARKVVWETAGFTHFAEPAKPGDTSEPAAPENSQQASGLAYTLLDDYTLSVSWQGNDDPASDLEIPATTEVGDASYQVSTIAAGAFANRGSLASVKLPSTITSIQDAAFAGCSNLQTIALPEGLRAIGERAFEATSVTDIWLPASVTSLGARAFAACSSLTSVVAQSTPQVASDALAECAGVNVYCPAGSEDSWNVGLPAANNHLAPYGITLPEESLALVVDQSASLLDNNSLKAPEPIEVSYAYAAKPVSIDADGIATGKAPGTSEVVVTLALDNKELARATRTVEVKAAPASEAPAQPTIDPSANLDSGEESSSGSTFAQLHTTVNLLADASAVVLSDTVSTAESVATGVLPLESDAADLPNTDPAKAGWSLDANGVLKVWSTEKLKDFGWTYQNTDYKTQHWGPVRDAVKSVDTTGVKDVNAMTCWFRNMPQLTDITNFKIPETTKLVDDVFTSDIALEVIPESFKFPDGATSVASCFNGCTSIKTLPAGFKLPSNVIEVGMLFGHNPHFTFESLPENFFPETVQNLLGFFQDWTSLETLPQDFKLPRDIKTANAMFYGCTSLKSVPSGLFDKATSLTDASSMFYGCTSLKSVPSGLFDKATSLTDASSMFNGCSSLESIPEGFALPSKAMHAARMFKSCSALRSFPASILGTGESLLDLTSLFNECSSLEAVPEGFQIPSNARSAESMFSSCASLKSVPRGLFDKVTSLTTIAEMFFGCSSLESIPQGFALPSSVTNAMSVFKSCSALKSFPVDIFGKGQSSLVLAGFFNTCSSLETLPEGFQIPSNVTDVGGMFSGCFSLKALPSNLFDKAVNVTSLDSMCWRCYSLETIPSGFKFPPNVENAKSVFNTCTSLRSFPADLLGSGTSITSVRGLFYNCLSLTSLPDGFAVPAGVETKNLFDVTSGYIVDGQKVPMYYAGTDAFLLNPDNWTAWSRVLITPESKPSGASRVDLYVKAEGETGSGSYWTTLHTDELSMLAEPAYAPSRAGHVFSLWYLDEACTRPVDFSKPLYNSTIYGQFVPGTRSGTLTTEAGTGSAYWSLADDGRLYLRGSGVVNMSIPDDQTSSSTYAWSPYRDKVTAVTMCPSLRASTTKNWFRFMKNLTDVQEVFVPQEAIETYGMFLGCSSLVSLPEGFSLPVGLKSTVGMFALCASLASLPASLVFPEGSQVFNVYRMFDGCTSLTALPEGFTIPTGVTILDYVLRACPKLSKLPDGFDFPTGSGVSAQEPFLCNPQEGQSRIATFYGGQSSTVLNYDWESQGRTLVTNEGEMGNFGMQRVTFKVQSATEDANGTFPWETRSVAWSNKQGIVADPGAPVLFGHTFSGWCIDEECLQPFDFATPLTAETTLYGTWVIAGAKNSQDRTGGELPCVDASNNAAPSTAWWRITADGTFLIKGEGIIGDLGFALSEYNAPQVYWEPYRNYVRRAQMDRSLGAVSMRAWFARMSSLADVSEVFIPEGCTDVGGLFSENRYTKTLPSDFYLPDSVTVADFFMSKSGITKLPEGFLLPPNLINAKGMFQVAWLLTSLPSKFTIPNKVETVANMFVETGLTSLPENFSIPNSVTNMDYVFYACQKLTVLPASFDFPREVALAAKDPFRCINGTVETYFAGGADSTSNVMFYNFSLQNRRLKTTVPDGKALVNLMLPNAANEYELYMRQLVDADSQIAELTAPTRQGYAFLGWYTNKECTTKFDFATGTVPAAGLELYGKYYKKSGTLPTTDNQNNATWELTEDGTLTIACQNGASISDLGWSNEVRTDKYWGPLRSLVTRIVMDPSVKVGSGSMVFWFCDMTNLDDISQVHIPYGVTNLNSLFNGCSSLKEIPEGFVIPDTVTGVGNCFIHCTSLTSIAENFTLPDSVSVVAGMFAYCSSLASLPEGFRLPKSATSTMNMFTGSGLRHLPNGFTLHEGIEIINNMFSNSQLESLPTEFLLPTTLKQCDSAFDNTKLTSLPDGFTIPSSVTNAGGMFRGTLLTALPEGFRIANPGATVHYMFSNCPSLTSLPKSFTLANITSSLNQMFGFDSSAPGYIEGPLTTYYAGDAADVKGADYWLANFNRTLVTAADPLPQNTYKVTFKLQKPGEAQASEWMTVLTDTTGRVSAPTEPTLFGYAFSGWKVKDASGTSQDFDFSQAVTADTVLEGSYTLITKVDVPLQAKVEVDASGNVTPASAEFVSRTPVALNVTQVTAEEAPGTAQLFPNASEWARVSTLVGLGSSSFRVSIGAGPQALSGGTLGAASALETTKLPVTLSLELNGAQLNYQPGEDITSFAKLTWTVEAA